MSWCWCWVKAAHHLLSCSAGMLIPRLLLCECVAEPAVTPPSSPPQVQRMRPSPFNKNSGKPKAAAAAAPRPASNLGKKAAAPAAGGKGKGKAVVDSSDSEVGLRPCAPWLACCHYCAAGGACHRAPSLSLPGTTWAWEWHILSSSAHAFHPPFAPLCLPARPHVLFPSTTLLQDEDDVVDMTISPAPARQVAPRRAAVNKPAPKYRESGSEEEESESENESDYAPSD